MDEIKSYEERTEILRAENEELDQEVSRAQKKRAIAEAKQFYGSDWKKAVGGAVKGLGKLRVKGEALHNLHSLGFGGGQELRNLSNPQTWKRR